MKFTFTDKKVNIPNRVHTYAEKKIGKLDRYFQTEPEASIVFSVEKGRNNLEVTIRSASTVIRSLTPPSACSQRASFIIGAVMPSASSGSRVFSI